MKVLVFAPFFPPDPTGSSVFAGQQVAELSKRGHDVLVITNQSDSKAPKSEENGTWQIYLDAVEVKRVRSIRINLGRVTWNYGIPVSVFGFLGLSVIKKLRKFQPDMMIIHSTLFDLSVLGLIWARITDTPAVIVSHTALWHDNSVINFCMKFYGRFFLRPFVKLSRAKVVCVDKWTLNNALDTFSNEKNVSTIPVSIELGTMRNGNGEKIRTRHEISEGPVLLSLGHVIPLRDRINLVNSLPLLVEKYPKLRVLVVGMLKERDFLDLAEKLGLEKHVIATGAVPHQEIKDYLAAADIELHDLNGLGLGITSVEAMDAGVPIVAWAVDDNYPQFSLRSYGESGFINDGEPETIASKVDQILSDAEFRSIVIKSQRKLVDEIYSSESVTNQYLALFT